MDYGVFDRGVNSIASSLNFAEKGKDKEFAACFREMIVAFYVGLRLVVCDPILLANQLGVFCLTFAVVEIYI